MNQSNGDIFSTAAISYDARADAQQIFNPQGPLAVIFAILCSLLGLIISLVTIYQHLLNYNTPLLQRSVIRILFITPVYSVLSLGSLLISDAYIFFDAVRDIWEAVVVYCFLSLILNYCGGENACAFVIQKNPGAIKSPWPFFHCLPPDHFKHTPILLRRTIPLNPAFVKSCKRSTLQFVAIKPVMAIITVVVSIAFGLAILEKPWWLWPQGILYNTSYSVALYALVLFYTATKSHDGLKGTRPLRKFAAVKIIVFATFWQSVLMFIVFRLHLSAADLRAWNLFLLCLEMPLIAILQAWAFPVSEFKSLTPTSVMANSDMAKKKSHKSLSNDVFSSTLASDSNVDVEIQSKAQGKDSIYTDPTQITVEDCCDCEETAKNQDMCIHHGQIVGRSLDWIDERDTDDDDDNTNGRVANHSLTLTKQNNKARRKNTPYEIKSGADVNPANSCEPLNVRQSSHNFLPAPPPPPPSFTDKSAHTFVVFRDKKDFYQLNNSKTNKEEENSNFSYQSNSINLSTSSSVSKPNSTLPSSVVSASTMELINDSRLFPLETTKRTAASSDAAAVIREVEMIPAAPTTTNSHTFLSAPMRLPKALQKQIDAVRDPNLRRVAFENAKDVISVTDVMKDAYYTFGRRYANHSLLMDNTVNTKTEDVAAIESEMIINDDEEDITNHGNLNNWNLSFEISRPQVLNTANTMEEIQQNNVSESVQTITR